MSQTHTGRCFCGAVEIEVTGEPVAAGYCHCASCRQWSAAPVTAFSLWNPPALTITKGEDTIGVYHRTEMSHRKFCKLCGGHLMNEHPSFRLVDIYPAIIPSYRHQPQVHVHYQESVLPIRDGLPKMRDLPKEMGGSGETLPE